MTTTRNLTCCVCGADAGRWAQHWNRDTGYGICPRCVATQSAKETSEAMARLYGQPGVNHDIPTTTHMGRTFRVLATARTQAQANAFMARTRRVLMHVSDGDGPDDVWCRMQCTKCKAETEWIKFDTVTQAKRGIPCPTCNTTTP